MRTRGPSMRRHRDGRAYCKLNGQFVTLGQWNDRAKCQGGFDRLISAWLANGRQVTERMIFDALHSVPAASESNPMDGPEAGQVTVDQVRNGYLAELELRGEDWCRNNLMRHQLALDPLVALFGGDRAKSFTPKKLKLVRSAMVESGRLCRKEINRRMRTVVDAFAWAVSEDLVEATVHHALTTVKALRRREQGTHEGRTVEAVPHAVVEATLPFMSAIVADIVRLLALTGARPSEILNLTPGVVDRSDPDAWIAVLSSHKTAHRDKVRVIGFDRQARAILQPYLLRPDNRTCFSPRESMAQRSRLRRQERKTPLFPAHQRRYDQQRKTNPERAPGDRYTATSLRRAIERAVRAANWDRQDRGVTEMLPMWSPYAIRHRYATDTVLQNGLDAAQLSLGHSERAMTTHYVHDTVERVRAAVKARQEKAG